MKEAPKKRLNRISIKTLHISRLIPNLITITSICFGLTSIRFALDGKWEVAVSLIIIAGLLDVVDGRVARMLNVSSKFGAQLDSLADFINFGVAPALVMYFALFNQIELRGAGWGLVLFYIICTCLRLARFNTVLEDENKPAWVDHYFVGVPAPAGAFLIVMPLMFDIKFGIFDTISIIPFYIYTVFIALLLISRIPTFSTKKMTIKKEYVVFVLIAFALIVVSLITEPWIFLPIIGLVYLGLIPFSYRSHKKKWR